MKNKSSHKAARSRAYKLRRGDKVEMLILVLLLFVSAGVQFEFSVSRKISHIHGIIDKIDVGSRSFSVVTKRQLNPISIRCNENTEFEIDGRIAELGEFKPSMNVVVWQKGSFFFSENVTKIVATVQQHLNAELKAHQHHETP